MSVFLQSDDSRPIFEIHSKSCVKTSMKFLHSLVVHYLVQLASVSFSLLKILSGFSSSSFRCTESNNRIVSQYFFVNGNRGKINTLCGLSISSLKTDARLFFKSSTFSLFYSLLRLLFFAFQATVSFFRCVF